MKHLLLTTIAAVLVVGCGPSVDIHEAAAKGNIEAVKQYLDGGGDVNAKDDFDGRTPLHYAAQLGHKEIVELLIANGADVNARRDGGRTPLLSAAYGHKEIVELLINAGADVNAKGYDGWTPLERAIKRNHPETADLLRKHGGKTSEELIAEGK